MKTAFTMNTRSNKDNIALTTLVAVTFAAIATGLFTSAPAEARPAAAIQTLDAIVVTAPRLAPAPSIVLDTIVVSAPRVTALA